MHEISAFETLSVLGSGQFGSVVLVRRNSDRKLFAAKIPHGEDDAARQTTRQEAQLLMQLHHVNIVQFVEMVEEDSQMAIVMEFASGGDLDTFLQSQRESSQFLSEPAIMRIFIQITLALQHLHTHRILHRDLKPKNILLDGDGIVKLSDFGVSKVLQHSMGMAQTITGTPHYMAPELLEGGSYDSKSDIWSLGCVLYELATFSPPFTGSALGAVVGQILSCDPQPIPARYTSPFRVLVSQLLEKDPHRRISLSEVMRSEVFQHYMMQLVSVATSHQPMLLDQFASKQNDIAPPDAPTLSKLPPPPLSCQFYDSVRESADQVKEADNYPTQKQPETNGARHAFFENQAAARRTKERVDQERSGAAVFLDYGERNSPAPQLLKPSVDRRAIPNNARVPYSFGCPIILSKYDPPPPPLPVRPRAQSSPSNYEELLHAERRRVQLETKALQERMRAIQASEAQQLQL